MLVQLDSVSSEVVPALSHRSRSSLWRQAFRQLSSHPQHISLHSSGTTVKQSICSLVPLCWQCSWQGWLTVFDGSAFLPILEGWVGNCVQVCARLSSNGWSHVIGLFAREDKCREIILQARYHMKAVGSVSSPRVIALIYIEKDDMHAWDDKVVLSTDFP